MLEKLKRITHILPMGVVGKHFLFKPITIQYPEEKSAIPEGYRGVHVFDADRCMGCGACARICPNKCIEIQVSVTPDGKKRIEKYNVYLGRCMFCGLCAEFCVGKDVIKLSQDYEVIGYSREDTIYDISRLSRNKENAK